MSDLRCKSCGQPNTTTYDRKYDGLCLDCSNAGVAELVADRDAARAEAGAGWARFADLKQRVAELERVAKGLVQACRISKEKIVFDQKHGHHLRHEKRVVDQALRILDAALADAAAVLGGQSPGNGCPEEPRSASAP